jgi:hypothetical protein
LDDDDVEAFNGRIRWVEAKDWFTARLFDLRSFVGCLLEGHFFASPSWLSFRLFLSCSVSFLLDRWNPLLDVKRRSFWDRLAVVSAKD